MENNIYQDVKSLAFEIKNAGEDEIYQSIMDAIDFSSTATEALLKIKYFLSKVNGKNYNNISTEIIRIEKEIDKILK